MKYGEDWMKNIIFRREVLYPGTKYGNSVAANILSFTVTNELGLENYLGYRCAECGANK